MSRIPPTAEQTGTVLDREPVRVPETELAAMRTVAQILSRIQQTEPLARPRLIGPDGSAVEIPATLYRVLRQAVPPLLRGESISIVHANEELTTQQAANILNVSRPYLIRLLDRCEIPFHRVGTHRRIRFEELMSFKDKRDAERRSHLRQMVSDAEEEGLYDQPEAVAG